MTQLITLTQSAKLHLSKLTQHGEVISLGVKNSGCSGFRYELTIIDEDNINHEDKHYIDGITFIIKPNDKIVLNNLNIDYQREGLNSKIVFNNPNTMNECGCGESFSLKEI
jgi:iron-sulfur cluster assembly accessory protein